MGSQYQRTAQAGGDLRGSVVQPPAQAGSAARRLRDFSSQVIKTSKDGDATTTPCNLWHCLTVFAVKTLSFISSLKLFHLHLCLLSLTTHHVPLRGAWLSLLCAHPIGTGKLLLSTHPKSTSFPGWTSPSPAATGQVLWPLTISDSPLLNSLSWAICFLNWWTQNWTQHLDVVSQGWAWMDDFSPQPAGCAPVNIAQDAVVQGHTMSSCSAHCHTKPHGPTLCPCAILQGSRWPSPVAYPDPFGGGRPACKCISWSSSVCCHLHRWQETTPILPPGRW